MQMGDSPESDSKIFSVRIVSIDYYMAPPIAGIDISYSSFQGGKVNEVPVIRIYGSTPAGQKTCLHVHRALPYLYVPYSDVSLQLDEEDSASTNAISLAIEKALKLKGNAGLKRQHVHGCSLVRAKKLYGFHSSEELFVKIYLYYPQDVSRAATLLLGGAVLDRIVQPHESHIPFLLQFLIDYNLYGMGHLHVSKIKFRHPVPEVFSPKKAAHTFLQRDLADKATGIAANKKVDSGADPSLASPIWTSSTIPDDWTWQSYSQSDSLVDQNLLSVKRQSMSELEGDAVVEDILNQLFISYTSLSQTRTDVKMVQSLIPIWEEFERNGEQGPAVPPDPGKPLPEDVLRILSDGLELEKGLADLSRGEYSSFSQDLIKSLTDKGTLVDKVNFLVDPDEALKCLEDGNLPSQTDDGENYGKGHNGHMKQLSADQLQDSNLVGPSKLKASDQDALGLLKWLASSQAAEEINSDDELAHQTILSSFLPTSTVDKALEKASTDFENQSQQECQDILDSVEDAVATEDSDDKASNSNHNVLFQTLRNEVIPQVDGSPDDPNSVPFGDKSSSEPNYVTETSQLAGLRLTERKRKRPQWGFLPVSSNRNIHNGISLPDNSDMTGRYDSDLKVSVGTSFHEKIVADKCPNCIQGDAHGLNNCTESSSELIGCSMRDLMRKKRSHRSELSECRAPQVIKVISDKEQKEEIFVSKKLTNDEECNRSQISYSPRSAVTDKLGELCECPALAEFAKVNTDGSDLFVHGLCTRGMSCSSRLPGEPKKDSPLKEAISSCCQSSNHVGCQIFEKNYSMLDSGLKSKVSMHEIPEMANDSKKDTGVSTTVNLLQTEPQINRHVKSRGCYSSRLSASSMIAHPVELIGLTLCQKPPVIEWTDEPDGDSALSPSISQDPHELVEKEEGISFLAEVADDVLPFFINDNREEKELRNLNCQEAGYSYHQDSIIGVPVHYQNDGSYLYMLTPVQSPPSEENVKRWLSLDGRNTSREKAANASVLSISPKHLSDDLMDSRRPLCPASNLSSLDSEARSESNLHQLNHHNQENFNGQVEAHNDEVRTIQKDAYKILMSKPSALFSQEHSQLSGPDVKSKLTPLSQMGFRDPASVGGRQQLTIVSIEVQAGCRGDLRPDPRFDAIDIITLVFQDDDDAMVDCFMLLRSNTVTTETNLDGIPDCKVLLFPEEKQVFSHFTKIMSIFDPDILIGWDVQGGSLGFLAERAAYLGIGLLNNISRTPSSRGLNTTEEDMPDDTSLKVATADPVPLDGAIVEDEWGRTHASGVHVGGRIVLNVWRLMRGEVKLRMYTIEAVAETVLRKKVPYIPCMVLAKWFSSGPGRARYRCMEYLLVKTKLNLDIMNQLDMINRTSELARVFGIDFFSVLSRGSQYRVESMFLRLAHTQNYVAISPGNLQVAYQPAMECLPLVMEPESGFYADPVVVLDFQSLYPSMIIAYNLCFSTCLGKITSSMANILGVSSYSPDMKVLQNLKHEILLTPNGVMYVPSKFRKGVLPRLLEEILSTRIMVKKAMKKLAPSQQVLHRIYDARQLALKLIANVTYGYTAAGFSGRMPCAELADSIVQCGRRTLEAAISFVSNHNKWKAKVVYGDTDSMFVLLKGRSRREAFHIGNEIVSAISAMNPNPVVLKMEKVYQPCFLLTKKRYVGYSYESPDQSKPKFDAKGIETVRRDTCDAVSKTMEQSLRLYFEQQDIDKVNAYLLRQWTRIISGRVSLQDFVFAKEVRLGTYSSRASSLPPSAIVATKAMRADPRAEPRYAERVPYVVVHGEPGARLVDLVVDPMELLALDSHYRLNEVYYIRKQIIPALQRVFGLVGADLNRWFSDMPRPEREAVGKRHFYAPNQHRTRIDFYYLSRHCILCGALVQASSYLCHNCSKSEATVATALIGRTAKLEKDIQHLAAICRHCGGGDWLLESGVKCTSLACSIFYERRKVQKELKSVAAAATELGLYPTCTAEWF
ncbi:DNA polymerase zeta catalytic subunit isoform X2 [Coffea arabica]|uniref:DNA polymerase n=1 Tax=Coffea arabica TaxID=13443 RepID=A0A6P6VYK3_COFAR|nr:DNA polymerase zeta catalytic subunit-like isoform X2 [Coffea arabica]